MLLCGLLITAGLCTFRSAGHWVYSIGLWAFQSRLIRDKISGRSGCASGAAFIFLGPDGKAVRVRGVCGVTLGRVPNFRRQLHDGTAFTIPTQCVLVNTKLRRRSPRGKLQWIGGGRGWDLVSFPFPHKKNRPPGASGAYFFAHSTGFDFLQELTSFPYPQRETRSGPQRSAQIANKRPRHCRKGELSFCLLEPPKVRARLQAGGAYELGQNNVR